jgi:hypothetical protein
METAPQENQARPSSAKPLTIGPAAGEVIERITANENALVQKLADYQPMVEIYLQDYVPDSRLGSVPKDDTYFLARLDLNGSLKTDSYLPAAGGLGKSILGAFKAPFSIKYMPNRFAAMMLVDGSGFDSAHYEFDYLGRELLGEVRCLVFDVKARGNRNNRFTGVDSKTDYSISTHTNGLFRTTR